MPEFVFAKKPVLVGPAGQGRRRGIAGSIIARFGKLRDDCSGVVLPFIALALPVIIGFAGLGTEAADWYLTKRTMQGAADAAATTAATSLAAGTTSSATLTTDGKAVTAQYNFVDGSDDTTVTVNNPPTSGPYQGRTDAVEVSISRQEPTRLSSLFLSHGPTITAHAVAIAPPSSEACVVALDKNNEPGMTVNGTADLLFPSCSLYVNSPASNALAITGNVKVNPNKAYLVGDYSHTGNSELKPATTNGIYTGVGPLIDPYKNVTASIPSACDDTGYSLSGNKSATKNAGSSGVYVFCDGIKLSGNSSLTLGSGTYIIAGGQLSISGGSSLIATSGTTIILTKRNGSCATAKISGGANINLVAPTTGSLAGIAVYQDRQCNDHSLTSDFSGGSTMNITGAIYFPEQTLKYSGGTSTGGAQCTQLIAWTITFTGNAAFQNNCAAAGTRKLSVTGGQLVE